jgi:hypothetical protein
MSTARRRSPTQLLRAAWPAVAAPAGTASLGQSSPRWPSPRWPSQRRWASRLLASRRRVRLHVARQAVAALAQPSPRQPSPHRWASRRLASRRRVRLHIAGPAVAAPLGQPSPRQPSQRQPSPRRWASRGWASRRGLHRQRYLRGVARRRAVSAGSGRWRRVGVGGASHGALSVRGIMPFKMHSSPPASSSTRSGGRICTCLAMLSCKAWPTWRAARAAGRAGRRAGKQSSCKAQSPA